MTSATTDRRLGLSGNAAIKTPCYCATTTAITLSGEQTIDGVTTSSSRVLVKNQSDATTNGIYVSDTGAWTRDLDFDGSYDAKCGTLVFVTNGSSNGAGLFQLTTADPVSIGSSNLTFTKIATLAGGSVTQSNVQNGQFIEVGSISGTNTITGTTTGTAPSALGHGQYVFFIPANTNTGATTFARDSLTALNVFYNGAALIGGELQASIPALLFHDGTRYHLISTAVSDSNYQIRGTVASASTVSLDAAAPYSQITGTTQINAITLGNGRIRWVEFAAAVKLKNGAGLILPTGADITTAAGDTAAFFGEGSSVTRCVMYQTASGNPLGGVSGVATLTSVAGTNTITATAPASMPSYSTTTLVQFIPAATNTGATTINVSSYGAKNVYSNGAACVGGEIIANAPCLLSYDGTQFNVISAAAKITSGTPTATTSGTTIDYTGLPATMKRITIMFKGVSTNGTSNIIIQIGPSGGVETTGYIANVSVGTGSLQSTAGFVVTQDLAAATTLHGTVTLVLENASSFTWVSSGVLTNTSTNTMQSSAGSKSTASAPTRVRITAINGTDVFDAGEVNLFYE